MTIAELEAECAAMREALLETKRFYGLTTPEGVRSYGESEITAGLTARLNAALAPGGGKALLERAEKAERILRLISEPCPHCGGTIGPGPGEPKPSLMCYGCAPFEAGRPRHGTQYGDYEQYLLERLEKAERERDEVTRERDEKRREANRVGYLAGLEEAEKVADERSHAYRDRDGSWTPTSESARQVASAIRALKDGGGT